MTEAWPGRPFPLGVLWDGDGTNFSLFSEHADAVEGLPLRRGRSRDAHPGLTSGPRSTGTASFPASVRASATRTASGPYEPERGHRFNPAKLLIDPYVKAIEGPIVYQTANVLPYVPDGDAENRASLPTTKTTRT